MREEFTGKQQEPLQKPKAYNIFFLVPQSRSNESPSLMLKGILIELLDGELKVKLETLRSELHHST